MAHIERRGPGRWRARFRDPSGRERSTTFARRSDAERFLTSVEHSKLVGGYVDPSAGRVTFERFSARWLESQTFDLSTREAVESRLRVHLVPAFGDLELRAIKPSTVASRSS
jgi:Phage integrase, N-terminal SAM-like domain